METNDGVLTPGQRIRPPGSEQIVLALLDKLYKLKAIKITELNAYDDRNYHVICEDLHENPHMTTISKNGYVLKIVNSLDSRKCRVIDAQNEILIFLNQRHINCPLPVKNVKGEYYSLETLTVQGYENSYAVRLLVYLPGVMLNRMSITSELLRNVGRFTSKLDTVLKGFSHSAYDNHKTLWMLTSVPDLRRFIYAVSNDYERDLAHQVIHAFEEDVLRVMPKLEQGIIHGDLNEQNIVVNSNGTEVTAAGDLAMGKYVIEGYQDIRKLTNLEKKILKVTVCARICQSLVMGAYSYLNDPQNDYLLVTQKSGWVLLKNLWPISQEEVLQRWGLTD
ncbi:hydroxylysine kinase isoform X2 [Nomia melanderi]|uniref:hydroxylysine kinase isoform X2 n=1 Tax=Nomia melanderi TaxID=2448451 RepID=UPI003FCE4BE9